MAEPTDFLIWAGQPYRLPEGTEIRKGDHCGRAVVVLRRPRSGVFVSLFETALDERTLPQMLARLDEDEKRLGLVVEHA